MSSKKTKIDRSWEILFDKHNIYSKVLKNGYFIITSSQINEVKEARLMAKFDQTTLLPQIFKDNNLSILPTARGEYIIGPFDTHVKIEYSDIKPQQVEIPNLETLDYTNLYSESSALLFAYNSGIIKDIMNDNTINYTVNGRMSSGEFEFQINKTVPLKGTQKISVKNAQIEIDSGYESLNTFCICEAKNIMAEEILIRQLYYPYRLWKNKISKSILPVLFIYSNDIFHAFLYNFEYENRYNSIKLIEHKAYTFANEEIKLNEIINIFYAITPISEPNITFPQADSFIRIIDLLSILYDKKLTRDEVTLTYEFNSRQTSYYISACEYLNLITRTDNAEGERIYELSKEAQQIMKLKYKQKYIALIKKILERPIFNKAFEMALQNSEPPSKTDIVRIMEHSSLNLNKTTLERRSLTVRSWIYWILQITISE